MSASEERMEEVRDILRQVASDRGETLVEDYSGRGMFGETCYGISTMYPEDVISAVKVKGYRQESLGKGVIVYWPWVKGI